MAEVATLETVLHSTLTKSRKKLVWGMLKAHVLVAWAMANNRVEYEDGGHEITNPVVTGRNPNVASYQYYDETPINQTNEFDTLTYKWSRVRGNVVISDQEQDENRGSSKIFDIMAKKIEVLEESMKEKFGEYMYGAGIGTDPNGLTNLIPDDPTTGTIGKINRATNIYARTSAYDFDGGLDATNIESVLDDLELDLRQKNEKPDVCIVGRDIYRMYRQAVRDKMTISLTEGGKGGKRMFDLGFKGVSHNGMPMVYDEDCPVDKMYLINSKQMKLHILRHVNMKVKKLTAPWTVDAVGRAIVWQGQWCQWKMHRTHAVVNR